MSDQPTPNAAELAAELTIYSQEPVKRAHDLLLAYAARIAELQVGLLREHADHAQTVEDAAAVLAENRRLLATLVQQAPTFAHGTLVRKRSGSQWEGRIVGRYSTALTPDGYAVESSTHAGSVQIYPAHALELVNRDCGEAGCAEGRCGTASCLKGGS